MPTPITLELDDSILAELRAGAADRQVSTETFARSAIESFLSWAAFFDDRSVPAYEEDTTGGLQPWQEERVERGRADAKRGAFASAEELDRIRRKYDD